MASPDRPDLPASPAQPRRLSDLLHAEQTCHSRLAANPYDVDALRSLGDLKQAFGQHAEATCFYQQALNLRPDDPDCARSLGNAFYLAGRFSEAASCYRQVLALRPDDADAHCNLGAALADQGQLEDALPCYEQALRLLPDFMNAHYNLGNAQRLLGRYEHAAASYAHALRLKPEFADGHNNLGIALHRLGRHAEAIASYQRALGLNPRFPKAHTNLGLTLAETGRLAEALACYEEALRLDPGFADAHRNRSLVWLLQADYDRGWPEYQWRWRCADFAPPRFAQPVWDGSPLEGRTVLLYTEQGLGDTLQFIRFARIVRERGGRAVVAAPPALHPLLEGCAGIDRLTARDGPQPPFDLHCPLMSLPAVLGLGANVLGSEVPYLCADPALCSGWRAELDSLKGFKVGIAWQGNPQVLYDRVRSIPLAAFEPLARVPGVRLVSLQKGHGTEQLQALEGRFDVLHLGARLDNATGPFLDTAAVLTNLDLLVTCDSVLAHLAGALGVRAWVALPAVPDWRWHLDRTDSPWYPSLRLFRQSHAGNWNELFDRIAAALGHEVSGRPSLSIAISPGELIDRITILEIKCDRIRDPDRQAALRAELDQLIALRSQSLRLSPEIAALTAELREVNAAIWDVEDELRLAEREQQFGDRFIALARSVYRNNDRRATLKRALNDLLGSRRHEEKLYTPYPDQGQPGHPPRA